MSPPWWTRRRIVCVGAGGVGKTTVSAAIALAAARAGQRALVVTVDPARRLAGALGLSTLPGQPAPLPAAALAAAGLPRDLPLFAMMLDQASAWDRLLSRHGGRAGGRVAAGRFYAVLSRRFAGTSEYLAIDELVELAGSGRFDRLVLDTPPGDRAVELLDAPARVRSLLDRKVLGWLPVGRGARRLGRAGAFLAAELEAATGGAALTDVADFLAAAADMADALAARAAAARAVLADPDTAVVLVCRPDRRGVDGAIELAARIRALGLALGGVVVNRLHPAWPEEVPAARLRAELVAGGLASHAGWLTENFLGHERRARGEAARVAELAEALPGLHRAAVPALDDEVHDLGSLGRVAERLAGR